MARVADRWGRSMSEEIRCSFHERIDAGGGMYHYKPVSPHTPDNGALTMTNPPSVGDLVWLASNGYRVVERSWLYPTYGSLNWPHGLSAKPGSTMLDIIVEIESGPFRNEVAHPE